jgi:hypothetical protein
MRLPSNSSEVRVFFTAGGRQQGSTIERFLFLSVTAKAQSMRNDTQIIAADFITNQKKHQA